MKKFFSNPKYILCLQALILFIVLWAVWYFNYYYSLLWLEGYSYFTTLPDLTSVLALMPDDLFKYMGAYLLQFFYNPFWGAVIQAGFATWILLCTGIVLIRLFRNPQGLMWLAFLPVPAFVLYQFWDLTLARSVVWCLCATLLMLIIVLVSLKVRFILPALKPLRHPVTMTLIPLAVVGLTVFLLTIYDVRNKNQELFGKLEYYGDHQKWEKILELVPPQDAQRNELKRRYALLALSETGKLSTQMFRYGITNPREFLFFNREEPFCRNFNALFYRAIGLPNEVIHQCYQQGVQSSFGFSFTILRRMADTYLQLKDYTLAKKYLDILSYSSYQDKWIESRLPILESIRNEKPDYTMRDVPFTVGSFLVTASSMVDRYPYERKYADLLLCGILADKNGNNFYPVFQIIAKRLYANGEKIPHYYEEALLLIAEQEKEILEKYTISQESRERYLDFMGMVQQGRTNAAKRKYPDTFWAYIF